MGKNNGTFAKSVTKERVELAVSGRYQMNMDDFIEETCKGRCLEEIADDKQTNIHKNWIEICGFGLD